MTRSAGFLSQARKARQVAAAYLLSGENDRARTWLQVESALLLRASATVRAESDRLAGNVNHHPNPEDIPA